MSDYWSAAPADRMLAAHCRPKGKFGTSVKRAAADKKYHSPWRRKSKKNQTGVYAMPVDIQACAYCYDR